MADQEAVLLQSLKTYEQTLQASVMAINNSTEQTEAIVASVAEVAASIIFPGVGSVAVAAIFAVVRLAGGRTFQSDNYYGALLYLWCVEGQNITDPSKVSDGQVLGALQWFEDKLGVFVSGREHLYALQISKEKYMSYYGVNSYTTQDAVRVQLAVDVMQKYMMGSGSSNVALGAWAKCVGVYDNAATAAIAASRVGNVVDQTDTTGALPGDSVSSQSMAVQSAVSSIWNNMSAGLKLVVGAFFLGVGYFLYRLFSGKSK